MDNKIVDHLFRNQYGKMIAVLTGFFGLEHLETIEDAVQDTFIKATIHWRKNKPENPEAWLIKASKNRVIDLLRKIKSEKNIFQKVTSGSSSIHLNDFFLEHEIEDNQLRMIFVACHPQIAVEEQIAFALKTVSGFSMKEIAAALLLKEETIKKRLIRARKSIINENIKFEFPSSKDIPARMDSVMRVIYLIFNEGFHSTRKSQLVDKELCGEAIRLTKLLLKKEKLRSGSLYALFALLCFQSSRLDSKTIGNNIIIDLENQDRSKWYFPLIAIGNEAMNKSIEYPDLSSYQYEATIIAEHLKSKSLKHTNWSKILNLYQQLNSIQYTDYNLLNIAIVYLQMNNPEKAKYYLDTIEIVNLEQRSYLFYGCYSEYYSKIGENAQAIKFLNEAISLTSNDLEKEYLINKKKKLEIRSR